MDIVAFLGVIILFLIVVRLSARISHLEGSLAKQIEKPAVAVASAPVAILPNPQTVPQNTVAAAPDPMDTFVTWLQTDWLLKIGSGLILIGFGWLVTYAFLNDWIGPAGRIAIGLAAGGAILLFGAWRMRKYVTQGGIFVTLGLTTILLTIYAARLLYGFFTPASALVCMFVATLLVAFVSVAYRAKALALLSITMAFVAPLLTHIEVPDYLGLFWYLLIVTISMMWVVFATDWGEVTFAALIGVGVYSVPHLIAGSGEAGIGTLLMFAYGFAALFFVTTLIGFLKTKQGGNAVDSITTIVNGLFLLWWIWGVVPSVTQSAVFGVWAIVFMGGAVGLYIFTKRLDALYTYAAVGLALIAAATAAQFHGATLTIAYTVESAAVCMCAYAVSRNMDTVKLSALLLLGPGLLSMASMLSSSWTIGAINQDFFVLFIMGAALMLLGVFFSQVPEKQQATELYSTFYVAGSYYWYILLWLSLHAGNAAGDKATFFALMVYTVIGVFCYAYGNWQGIRGVRVYGGALLGFVVVRLLLVDIWTMALNGRIVTFFLIGALLVSTAFMGKKTTPSPATPVA